MRDHGKGAKSVENPPGHVRCSSVRQCGVKSIYIYCSLPRSCTPQQKSKMVFKAELFAEKKKWIVSEIEAGFVHVQYNHPKTLNAFATEDWKAYEEILTALENDPATKVILISSAVPKSFSSGLNLAAAMGLMNGKEEWPYQKRKQYMYQHIREFQDAIAMPARMRTPTIALINGICYGLGLDLASACSIRVAVDGARMSIREIKIGIVADIGSLQRMTNLVSNKSKMYQYALTGEVFSAQDAMDIGFVSKVVPDLDSGLQYCRELGRDINQNVQWAIKGTKECIQYMVDGGSHEQGLLNVAEYNATHLVGGLPKNDFKGKL